MRVRAAAASGQNDRQSGIQQWRGLLFGMADTERFGHMRMHDYVNDIDTERAIQFSAIGGAGGRHYLLLPIAARTARP